MSAVELEICSEYSQNLVRQVPDVWIISKLPCVKKRDSVVILENLVWGVRDFKIYSQTAMEALDMQVLNLVIL